MENETRGVFVSGKVNKVNNPKMYQYGPKFFMEVNSKQYGTVKAMVSIENLDNPTRQLASRGDTVEFTGKEIKDGWINVTPRYHYAIINDTGKQVINREIYNNKFKIVKTHINDLRKANFITEDNFQKFWDLLLRSEEHGGVFESLHPHVSSLHSPPKLATPIVEKYENNPPKPDLNVKPHFLEPKELENSKKVESNVFSLPCPRCDGTGEIDGETCSFCKGKGVTSL